MLVLVPLAELEGDVLVRLKGLTQPSFCRTKRPRTRVQDEDASMDANLFGSDDSLAICMVGFRQDIHPCLDLRLIPSIGTDPCRKVVVPN